MHRVGSFLLAADAGAGLGCFIVGDIGFGCLFTGLAIAHGVMNYDLAVRLERHGVKPRDI